MKLDFRHVDTTIPFALSRALIPRLDELSGTTWSLHPLTKAAFHRPGRPHDGLSDQQIPGDQIRFSTAERVRRGLRLVASDLGPRLAGSTMLELSGTPEAPDREFVSKLIRASEGRLNIRIETEERRIRVDARDEAFLNLLAQCRDGRAGDQLRESIAELLSYGDSWSAHLLAKAYVHNSLTIDPALADVLGLAFALQGETAMAEHLYALWGQGSALDEARARYSLSMLYARHHPPALRDADRARENLEKAWNLLLEVEESDQSDYERVFNGNGYALLLFRESRFLEAAELLERSIESLERSNRGARVHHTVLISNLGRVYAAMGDLDKAEVRLREATRLDPLFAEYWQDLASFLCDQAQHEEALQAAERAVELDPSIPEVHRLRGFILLQLRAAVLARDSFHSAARLGDVEAVVDACKASNEAETWNWTAARLSSLPAAASPSTQAELGLLRLQAMLGIDSGFDARSELESLLRRFPEDPLLEQNWRANFA